MTFEEWEKKAKILGIRDDFRVYTKIDNKLELVEYKGRNKDVIIPPVNKIRTSTFKGNRNIKSIKLIGNVNEIANFALSRMYELEKIDLYDSEIEYIDSFIIKNTPRLMEIILPKNLLELSTGALSNLLNLSSIELPRSLITIESGVFAGSGLTNIVIPENVQFIGDSEFDMCTNLEEITILSRRLVISTKLITNKYHSHLYNTYRDNSILGNCMIGENLPNLKVIRVNKEVAYFVKAHTLPKYHNIILEI